MKLGGFRRVPELNLMVSTKWFLSSFILIYFGLFKYVKSPRGVYVTTVINNA